MSQNQKFCKNVKKKYSRKYEPISKYNPVPKKSEVKYDYHKEKKDEKKRRNTSFIREEILNMMLISQKIQWKIPKEVILT